MWEGAMEQDSGCDGRRNVVVEVSDERTDALMKAVLLHQELAGLSGKNRKGYSRLRQQELPDVWVPFSEMAGDGAIHSSSRFCPFKGTGKGR